jgi:rubredoxin
MTKNVELLDVMAITWECQTCLVEFDTQAPIYSTLEGEFVVFICDNCGHYYEIDLEGKVN